MRQRMLLSAAFLFFCGSFAYAQPAPASISQQLRSFSPMAQIYLKHLGLADRNSNGVIDKGENEGYEVFTAKYGNADVGFHANRVLCGANNGKLEEPEIVNHYFLNIRFAAAFERETAAIEDEVKKFVYTHDLPLVWMDDEQGTVMKAVNRILGEYILENIHIANIMKASGYGQTLKKDNLKVILLYMVKGYGIISNSEQFARIETILRQYYGKEKYVNDYIVYYRP